MSHALNHLALDGAIAVSLTVEILRSVAHPVPGIADDWDRDLGVVGEAFCLAVLGGRHCDLESGGKRAEAVS